MQVDKIIYSDLAELKNLQPDGWSNIVPEFKRYVEYNFCEPIKISHDGRIVGIGTAIIFKESAWLAHIIVNKDNRNQGIGYRIVDHLVSELKSRNIRSIVLIATDLGEPVYKKAGFTSISDYIFLERESKWSQLDISKNIVPYSEIFYDQIIDLDISISGEYREPLIREHLNKGLVYHEKQDLEGFYLPTLGEGLIFAKNPEAGIELMKAKYPTAAKAVIPSENGIAIEYLIKKGFSKTNSIGKRMILGEDIYWKPGCFFGRIGGNLG